MTGAPLKCILDPASAGDNGGGKKSFLCLNWPVFPKRCFGNDLWQFMGLRFPPLASVNQIHLK